MSLAQVLCCSTSPSPYASLDLYDWAKGISLLGEQESVPKPPPAKMESSKVESVEAQF